LAIPRARLVNSDGEEGEWRSVLLPRYRRSSPEVEQAVLGVYLSGGNTRRIRGALKPLLGGAPLSKSAVSRLVNRLEESYERWSQRDLAEDHIVYLYLDAIYPKVRSAGKVVSLPVLVALGVKPTGEKVLLALAIAGAETGPAAARAESGPCCTVSSSSCPSFLGDRSSQILNLRLGQFCGFGSMEWASGRPLTPRRPILSPEDST
jgi:transposase-like protein